MQILSLHAIRAMKRLLSRDYRGEARLFYENACATRSKVVELLGRDKDIRILDVGCGETYAATILFTGWGWRTTGIDVYWLWQSSPWRALASAAKAGPREVLKRLAHEFVCVRKYHSGLLQAAGIQMPDRLDLRHMSVNDLAFGDCEFDLVYSHAVLEHVFGLDQAMAEMKRVMKPGAVGRHAIHLFTSLSGGHDPAWGRPDEDVPESIPPWNHLLTGQSPNIGSLNCLREKDYRQSFERQFEILEWAKAREGENILTPQLRDMLSDYSEDELLTRTIEVVVRRPA